MRLSSVSAPSPRRGSLKLALRTPKALFWLRYSSAICYRTLSQHQVCWGHWERGNL